MSLKIVRRIRGNIHGSIDITELEDKVIGHRYFQRLRRIKQLAFLHYVFPGATHTRFEHSLGVMHLAAKAWERLRSNQERFKDRYYGDENFASVEERIKKRPVVHGTLMPTFRHLDAVFGSPYVLQVLRLAGLLHDLGHPPFSHSGCHLLPTYDDVLKANSGLPSYLFDFLQCKREALKSKDQNPEDTRVDHEIISMIMIHKVLNDTYKKYPQLSNTVDPRDVISIISNGIKPKQDSSLIKNKIYLLCQELISGELDIDRMDYLLRDSKECGIVYGIFDAGRILDSLFLYFDPVDQSQHVAINISGLPAFEDYLRARHSMYLQLYFHKTSVGAEAMMGYLVNMLGYWHLSGNIEEYANVDEYNISSTLLQAAKKRLDQKQKRLFSRLINDLLFERNLWKRIYEASNKNQNGEKNKRLKMVYSYLKDKNYRYAEVLARNSLTRFRPRKAYQRSPNYLRLIKKDELLFPRVFPIEDYSSLINMNDNILIDRIYLDVEGDSALALRVRKDLNQLFLKESNF